MYWLILIPLVLLAARLFYKRTQLVPVREAVELLKLGALLIDVRSTVEFSGEHLPRALHMPLDHIQELIAAQVEDRRHPLLLHCQSGMRSSIAVKRLQKLGYSRVFNLGSYARAEEIVKSAL